LVHARRAGMGPMQSNLCGTASRVRGVYE